VVRLNGGGLRVDGRSSGYALTDDDLLDWVFRLREGRALPSFIDSRLRHGARLLSLGHSADDAYQRALLRVLTEKQIRGTSGWALALRPAALSTMTWQRYRMTVHVSDLNEWAARMRSTE
jgi:hypothetical protein